MKRVTAVRQTEDYYMIPDDVEVNESMFYDFQPSVSILKGVQVLKVTQFDEPIKDKTDETNSVLL